MPYHSELNKDFNGTIACGCAFLPIKTSISGKAPVQKDTSQEDIIDETIKFFRPNVLFKTYEILSEADRTLLYLSFYLSLCLRKIEQKKCADKASADKILFQLAQDRFQAPGESGFVLGGFFSAPKTSSEGTNWTNYMKHARQELGVRLLDTIFPDPKAPPSKFWMQFAKRKLLGKELKA